MEKLDDNPWENPQNELSLTFWDLCGIVSPSDPSSFLFLEDESLPFPFFNIESPPNLDKDPLRPKVGMAICCCFCEVPTFENDVLLAMGFEDGTVRLYSLLNQQWMGTPHICTESPSSVMTMISGKTKDTIIVSTSIRTLHCLHITDAFSIVDHVQVDLSWNTTCLSLSIDKEIIACGLANGRFSLISILENSFVEKFFSYQSIGLNENELDLPDEKGWNHLEIPVFDEQSHQHHHSSRKGDHFHHKRDKTNLPHPLQSLPCISLTNTTSVYHIQFPLTSHSSLFPIKDLTQRIESVTQILLRQNHHSSQSISPNHQPQSTPPSLSSRSVEPENHEPLRLPRHSATENDSPSLFSVTTPSRSHLKLIETLLPIDFGMENLGVYFSPSLIPTTNPVYTFSVSPKRFTLETPTRARIVKQWKIVRFLARKLKQELAHFAVTGHDESSSEDDTSSPSRQLAHGVDVIILDEDDGLFDTPHLDLSTVNLRLLDESSSDEESPTSSGSTLSQLFSKQTPISESLSRLLSAIPSTAGLLRCLIVFVQHFKLVFNQLFPASLLRPLLSTTKRTSQTVSNLTTILTTLITIARSASATSPSSVQEGDQDQSTSVSAFISDHRDLTSSDGFITLLENLPEQPLFHHPVGTISFLSTTPPPSLEPLFKIFTDNPRNHDQFSFLTTQTDCAPVCEYQSPYNDFLVTISNRAVDKPGPINPTTLDRFSPNASIRIVDSVLTVGQQFPLQKIQQFTSKTVETALAQHAHLIISNQFSIQRQITGNKRQFSTPTGEFTISSPSITSKRFVAVTRCLPKPISSELAALFDIVRFKGNEYYTERANTKPDPLSFTQLVGMLSTLKNLERHSTSTLNALLSDVASAELNCSEFGATVPTKAIENVLRVFGDSVQSILNTDPLRQTQAFCGFLENENKLDLIHARNLLGTRSRDQASFHLGQHADEIIFAQQSNWSITGQVRSVLNTKQKKITGAGSVHQRDKFRKSLFGSSEANIDEIHQILLKKRLYSHLARLTMGQIEPLERDSLKTSSEDETSFELSESSSDFGSSDNGKDKLHRNKKTQPKWSTHRLDYALISNFCSTFVQTTPIRSKSPDIPIRSKSPDIPSSLTTASDHPSPPPPLSSSLPSPLPPSPSPLFLPPPPPPLSFSNPVQESALPAPPAPLRFFPPRQHVESEVDGQAASESDEPQDLQTPFETRQIQHAPTRRDFSKERRINEQPRLNISDRLLASKLFQSSKLRRTNSDSSISSLSDTSSDGDSWRSKHDTVSSEWIRHAYPLSMIPMSGQLLAASETSSVTEAYQRYRQQYFSERPHQTRSSASSEPKTENSSKRRTIVQITVVQMLPNGDRLVTVVPSTNPGVTRPFNALAKQWNKSARYTPKDDVGMKNERDDCETRLLIFERERKRVKQARRVVRDQLKLGPQTECPHLLTPNTEYLKQYKNVLKAEQNAIEEQIRFARVLQQVISGEESGDSAHFSVQSDENVSPSSDFPMISESELVNPDTITKKKRAKTPEKSALWIMQNSRFNPPNPKSVCSQCGRNGHQQGFRWCPKQHAAIIAELTTKLEKQEELKQTRRLIKTQRDGYRRYWKKHGL
ncbi:hypothetical protein BLNAU_9144 [Blattamonas nauphoetae]|uniref:Uncharacterized protein n=1 Tax=Blattamonas nauphoetae TaxID=2049346 RepID=A0ABQ9XWD5_9EUKA|nr:hypothetical protein BLNAU_9144 [Blattamonas nauphoetae]